MCRAKEIDCHLCPASPREEEDALSDTEAQDQNRQDSPPPPPPLASFYPQPFLNENSQMAFLMIKRQLMLLIHANYCTKIDNMFPDRSRRGHCDLQPHCDSFKAVLEHLRTCQTYPHCDTFRCVSSRNILSHYCSCFNISCRICF